MQDQLISYAEDVAALLRSEGVWAVQSSCIYSISQRVLGMEACSTCTFSNDNNRYCGAGADMYTGNNCTQREARCLAPYIDIGDTTS